MTFSDDEIPTQPSVAKQDPEMQELIRIYSCLSTVEKRRFGRMIHHWFECSINRQVLVEESAREFADK